jgi:hypothetical protein
MRRRLCLLGVFLAMVAVARADEIRLKDGSKIVGTIVDFENESFKVQTSYGFAMVRKDSIAQIIPSEPAKPVSSATTPAPSAASGSETTSAPSAKPQAQPAVARGTTSSAPAVSAASLAMPAPIARPKPVSAPAAMPPAPVSAAPASVAAVPVAESAPPAPPAPPVIQDAVQGTLYTNQTYNFQLYRPPGWDLMPEARKSLPNAITAMGTTDETTIFVVGRETLRDSLEAHAANAVRALRQIYENYRPGVTTKVTVGGVPAVEWRFRGIADGHDWSVTALTISRGSDVFTLLGMTYADSDLIQLRENVISKMINSLVFVPAH